MRFLFLALLACLAPLISTQAQEAPEPALQHAPADTALVKVCADDWPPFVDMQDRHQGRLTRTVKTVLHHMGRDMRLEVFPFAYCYQRVRGASEFVTSFPWFDVSSRQGEVVLSEPLVNGVSQLYFNRRFNRFAEAPQDLSKYRIGVVLGYSYGQEIDDLIDQPIVFSTEKEALSALLSGAVDILPMTSAIAEQMLAQEFISAQQLVQAIPGFSSQAGLHFIAPNTDEGIEFIAQFNASLLALREAGAIAPPPVGLSAQGAMRVSEVCEDLGYDQPAETSPSAAVLTPADGFPMIIGRNVASEDQLFALPQGTKVLVMCWSPRVAKPSSVENQFKTMIEESVALILNGPHVGREMYIKNMYLTLGD